MFLLVHDFSQKESKVELSNFQWYREPSAAKPFGDSDVCHHFRSSPDKMKIPNFSIITTLNFLNICIWYKHLLNFRIWNLFYNRSTHSRDFRLQSPEARVRLAWSFEWWTCAQATLVQSSSATYFFLSLLCYDCIFDMIDFTYFQFNLMKNTILFKYYLSIIICPLKFV